MLVLTRKLMEKLYIGENICVTVVRLEGGQVRLGIEAPREISVVRAELLSGRCNRRPIPVDGPLIPANGNGTVRIPPFATHGTDIQRHEPSQ